MNTSSHMSSIATDSKNIHSESCETSLNVSGISSSG